MLKFITSIIAGAVVGALGVYFTLDWQEEKLAFTITSPAKFGQTLYQNITLSNNGWNPAVNIKMYINNDQIGFENIQATSPIKKLNNEKNGIATIDRLRRDESIVLSIAYEGYPLPGDQVRIVSDRSIALQKEFDEHTHLPTWAVIVMSISALLLTIIIWIIAAVSIPAYKGYVKRAKESEQKYRNR